MKTNELSSLSFEPLNKLLEILIIKCKYSSLEFEENYEKEENFELKQ